MKKKLIFVGIHHKPGLQPLDSSTLSGQRIDHIIASLPPDLFDVHKTNLFDTDYMPWGKKACQRAANGWKERNFGDQNIAGDVVVLLGNDVQKYFPVSSAGLRVVEIAHPAIVMGSNVTEAYIAHAVGLIQRKLLL